MVGEWKLEHHYLPTGFIPQGEERKPEVLRAPPRTAAHVGDLVSAAVDQAAEIAAGNFTPRRGDHCERCFFKEKCAKDTRRNAYVGPSHVQWDLFEPPPRQPKPRVEWWRQPRFAEVRKAKLPGT